MIAPRRSSTDGLGHGLGGEVMLGCTPRVSRYLNGLAPVLCRAFYASGTGRSTGEAYVELTSPEAAQQALEQLHKETMGHRYVE
jgi:hypothetical protein